MKTFEEWCQDREIVLNELSPKLLTMAYKIWGEECCVEGQRYEAENATLRERLEKAVELPMIYEHITYPFFEGMYSETVFYVVYKENGRIITINCGKSREAAEARLKELKGEKECAKT